jgi:adenylate kinase family enzyme
MRISPRRTKGLTGIPIHMDKQKIVFVLGGPGSGKGTLCEKLSLESSFKHISVGELLREEAKKETERGNMLKELLAKGFLSPDETTIEILSEEMNASVSVPGFLIDGFPRTKNQSEMFEENIKPANVVIYLDAKDEVMIQRIMDRAKMSSEANARSDDNIESLKKRLEIHHTICKPVVDVLKDRTHVVDANASKEQVFSIAKELLHPSVAFNESSL